MAFGCREAHGDIIRAIATGSGAMATASNDATVKLWAFDGLEMSILAGHQSYVYSVGFCGDGGELVSASDAPGRPRRRLFRWPRTAR